ncbi:MAG: alpha/beta hydrolase [Deltaproteobacteria bacterium]|nr:alpha/beta hydrolase [Deltaproteobacteria bacterium]
MVDLLARHEPWWSRSGTAMAADGTPLAFAAGGPEGSRAIVACNGLGVSTFFWDYVGRRYARDHHVVVWDYRGHGASGEPHRLQHIRMADIADDLARVMDANQIDRAVLLGHSLGCQVIFEFYRLFPDRVLGLVPILGAFGHAAETFIDPRVGRAALDIAYAIGTRAPEVINLAGRVALRSRVAWPFARLTGLVHRDMCRREDMDPYLEHLSRMNSRVFVEMARAAQDHDAGPWLGDIRCPTLVVAGERDLFTPRRLSLEMAQRIPNAELLEIPRGSHAALIEQPELINLRLEKFIHDRIAPFESERLATAAAEPASA